MEIGRTGATKNIAYEYQMQKKNHTASENVAGDKVKTSKKALMLSRSLADLKKEMQPREDILQKFAGTIDSPVELSDQDLDRMLSRIF